MIMIIINRKKSLVKVIKNKREKIKIELQMKLNI